MYPQALFCLEEIILVYPHAYNIFARMGEVSCVLAMAQNPGRDVSDILLDAVKYYLRSIELCEDYLRAYYGLVLVCSKVLKLGKVQGKDKERVEALYTRGQKRLGEIVSRARRRDKGWEGYSEAEVSAASKLLEDISTK